ncbi:MAG: type IV secretion system DNA-binding domain-containing protein [Candidatus Moranbacteria bacterium]|jgi:CxxC-x17-CxxC domain-containing protein|nr:type IV secretion system DNA-binding domain-containing protein [Candidatus Moranbacteria bacterium]
MSDITFFAKTNFRNQETEFGIKTDDRRRHMYVIGKTGMGKTNLLEHLVIQDIRNGRGVAYIDPHGDTAEKILRAVPSERINDVIYLNPSDAEFPIAFNILEAVDEDKKNLVASGMMGVFKKIWPDVWSPRMEYILNNTILALLDYPGSTMLGVSRMMSDKDYRKRVYVKIKDPVVKSFWINEFDKWEDRFRKEAVAAIQNKVGQFLSSSVIRHIVGQPKSTIDMREIMDNKKILIVNLSKGRIGEDAMRLLGGMIVTKMQLGVMGRVDIPEEKREDFYLHVDEFQNFATESFASILSEARKYRLSLTLAHQYISQLVFDGNTTVRDAVFGNVGTIIAFRVGAEDSEQLEKEFEPVFTANDIINLPKYHIYLKLMIDGVAGDAFSATTLPPVEIESTEKNFEKIIRNSRERYSSNKKEVEERIARWSGMVIDTGVSFDGGENDSYQDNASSPQRRPQENRKYEKPPVQSRMQSRPKEQLQSQPQAQPRLQVPIQSHSRPQVPTPEKREEQVEDISEEGLVPQKIIADEVERVLYDAKCATCETGIKVPFQPDGKRPTFCKDCLKDYQRTIAKAKQQMEEKENVKKEPNKNIDDQRIIERVTYKAPENPVKLSQLQHVAPKKFKNLRKKPNVDLKEIRDLINKNRGEK